MKVERMHVDTYVPPLIGKNSGRAPRDYVESEEAVTLDLDSQREQKERKQKDAPGDGLPRESGGETNLSAPTEVKKPGLDIRV